MKSRFALLPLALLALVALAPGDVVQDYDHDPPVVLSFDVVDAAGVFVPAIPADVINESTDQGNAESNLNEEAQGLEHGAPEVDVSTSLTKTAPGGVDDYVMRHGERRRSTVT